MNTAESNEIRTLYHWQPYNAQWLERTLLHHVIYLSNPAGFNDPWDCRPFFDPSLLDDPSEQENYFNLLADVWKRNGVKSEDMQRHFAMLGNDWHFRIAMVLLDTHKTARLVQDHYRIYCLSPNSENLLMWAHYADSHRGVCLEFDATGDVFRDACQCLYYDDYPKMRLYSESLWEDIFLPKAKAWSYENEYRLVAVEKGSGLETPSFLVTEDSFLRIPKEALRSVIVGCQGDFNTISAQVRDLAPHVQVKMAKRARNKYSLVIEE